MEEEHLYPVGTEIEDVVLSYVVIAKAIYNGTERFLAS